MSVCGTCLDRPVYLPVEIVSIDELQEHPPLTQRFLRTIFEFFNRRPVVQILAVGIPLIAVNATAGSTARLAGAILLALGGMARAAGAGIAAVVAAGAAAEVGVGAGLALEALAAGEATEVVALMQISTGMLAAAAGAAAAEAAEEPQAARNYLAVGAAVSGLACLSTLANGGGLVCAIGFSAISALFFKTVFRIDQPDHS